MTIQTDTKHKLMAPALGPAVEDEKEVSPTQRIEQKRITVYTVSIVLFSLNMAHLQYTTDYDDTDNF